MGSFCLIEFGSDTALKSSAFKQGEYDILNDQRYSLYF